MGVNMQYRYKHLHTYKIRNWRRKKRKEKSLIFFFCINNSIVSNLVFKFWVFGMCVSAVKQVMGRTNANPQKNHFTIFYNI